MREKSREQLKRPDPAMQDRASLFPRHLATLRPRLCPVPLSVCAGETVSPYRTRRPARRSARDNLETLSPEERVRESGERVGATGRARSTS